MTNNKLSTLRFDFEAILQLEEKGFKLMDGGLKEDEVKKPKTFVTLYWAGRLADQPDLTEEAALKELRGIPAREVVNAIIAAIKQGLGSDEPQSAAASS